MDLTPKLRLTLDVRGVGALDLAPRVPGYVEAGGAARLRPQRSGRAVRRRPQSASPHPRRERRPERRAARAAQPSTQGRGCAFDGRRAPALLLAIAIAARSRAAPASRRGQRHRSEGGLHAQVRALRDLAARGVPARAAGQMVLCIIGDDPFGAALDQAAVEPVGRRPPVRRQAAALRRRARRLRDRLRRRRRTPARRSLRSARQPILTVTDARSGSAARHDPFHDRRRAGPLLHRQCAGAGARPIDQLAPARARGRGEQRMRR